MEIHEEGLTAEQLDAVRQGAGIAAEICRMFQKASTDELPDWKRSRCYSVETREAWGAVGHEHDPGEFRLLLAGGGPTVWLDGDLDGDHRPENASLHIFDQGGEVRRALTLELREYDALLWFARLFDYR